MSTWDWRVDWVLIPMWTVVVLLTIGVLLFARNAGRIATQLERVANAMEVKQ